MMTKTSSLAFKRLLTIALLATTSLQSFSQSNSKKMKITKQQAAPTFTTNDVNGATVNLSDFKGKKVLLTFYRNVGCPICNLRFHELQEQADYFKSKGLVLLAVYESSADNMRQYLEGENPYAIMIPNPDQSLYQLYDIDKSMGKVMKGLFHGALGKVKKGKKLFKHEIKTDGSSERISADFLIDESGKINTAYYGKFLGDHLPITEIKQFLN
jgi:peroxiredoxin Q/BCP